MNRWWSPPGWRAYKNLPPDEQKRLWREYETSPLAGESYFLWKYSLVIVVIGGVAWLLYRWASGNLGTSFDLYDWCMLMVFAAGGIEAIFRVRRRFSSFALRMLRELGYCTSCGYNLAGNTSGQCSECGEPVPPADPTSSTP